MSILKSGKYDPLFYQDLWVKLTHFQIWEGELINKHKDGHFFVDKTIIIPIYGEDKVITNYVTIKKDITLQKERDALFRTHIREAQMGEMVSIIAHQWKQPLATLASIGNSLMMQAELESLSSEFVLKKTEDIASTVQFMSETMDDFRGFYSPNEDTKELNLKELFYETILLIDTSIRLYSIDFDININANITIKTYKNELKQVFLNLIKNFVDIVEEKQIHKPHMIVNATETKNHIIFSIEDNGGGIPPEIISKLFNVHFTTKSQSKGTGLGLYMCKMVLEEHCHGTIKVQNFNEGALFTIELEKI